ncbi:hypothetical protein [Winogradskyella sp.]|uniref:hypothetical protein n=1 Tax=Winogradskyella sp. TaxID=1883156 RepID=UPI002636F131|nr:hypothetical protein [Winogradskyella sp.]
MNLEDLNQKELLEINGGTEESYNLGHAIGSHIRSGIETIGNIISWAADLLPFGE